jgi:hypothetical protein
MLQLSLFENRVFSAATVSALLNHACVYAVLFVLLYSSYPRWIGRAGSSSSSDVAAPKAFFRAPFLGAASPARGALPLPTAAPRFPAPLRRFRPALPPFIALLPLP